MRRSSSSSHIPVVKTDMNRKRSHSISRTSSNCPSTSKVKSTIPTIKRTNSSSNLKVTPVSSKPHGLKKSSLTPNLLLPGKRSTSQNFATPSTSRSRSRSPYSRTGSERKVNDKTWVSQQFSKVRWFLQTHKNCPEHVPDIIKPPTIETFVFVMNLLVKEIRPYVEITKINYKEVLPNILKTFRYPGSLSNSQLKTVNTMHAWPQIIGMWAWFVDLINTIKRVDLPVPESVAQNLSYQKIECVVDHLVDRYLCYNAGMEDLEGVNKAFVEKFGKILNIDEGAIKQLRAEVTSLTQLKEKQLKTIEEQKAKNDAIAQKVQELQNEIDEFYLNREQRREDISYALIMAKERKVKLVEAIKAKKDNIAKLTEIIKVQPCTLQEKNRMLKHIEEMKHTIELKKEKIKLQRNLKNECYVRVTEALKKVETEVYSFNTQLMKIAVFEPDLKVLQLKETDFLSPDFTKAVTSLDDNIKTFEKKFNTDIEHQKSLLSQVKTDISNLEQQIQSVKKNIQALKKTQTSVTTSIEVCHKEMEELNRIREAEKQAFLQKIQELKSGEMDILQARQKLEDVTELKNKKQAELEKLKEKSLEFMLKVHDRIMCNLTDMSSVRDEIVDMLANSMKKVEKSQGEIIQDLHNLDKLQDIQ